MTDASDNRHLLIVDDEAEIREILVNAVSAIGTIVSEAASGAQALEMLQLQKYDAVMSDIKMPVMSGLECLAESIAQGVTTPFVFITGYGDSKNIIQAVRLGAIDFIEKPFDTQEVIDVVSRALDVGARRKRIMHELHTESPELYRKVRHEQKMISLLLANNNLKRQTK